MLSRLLWALLAGVMSAQAAQISLDWSKFALNQSPTGFASRVSGSGQPGEWRIITDEVPPVLASFNANAPIQRRPVLAQVAREKTDEHFPLLVYEGETFQDFTLKTRFKTVAGEVEQMAGIAFRIRDEKNYYVVRASSLGNNLRFYKFVDGQRTPPIGPEIPVPAGVWHSLTVECKGNTIRVLLNDKEALPPLTDNSFAFGKIAFWTKSDSVSHFVDTLITYRPRESEAAVAVRDLMKNWKSLLAVKLFRFQPGSTNVVKMIGSDKPEEIGQPGGKAEVDTLLNGHAYYAKGKDRVELTLPIRDKNGEIIAAARLALKTFAGQTEENAIGRATPIRQELEMRLQSAEDWE
jgi:hypothetical protein